jgi:hypothetical protein
MSTSLTVYGSTSDGHFYATTDGLYFSVARDAVNASVISAAATTMRLGLAYINPPLPGDKYRFYRLGLYFDTSAIPTGATIVSATMSLYLVGNVRIISQGFDAVLMKMKTNDGTYPHDPLSAGDFDRTLWVSGGASSPGIYNGSSGYVTFTFNTVGKAEWINDAGLSKFLVMSSLDIGYTAPNLWMYAEFYTREQGTSYAPRLTVIYAILCAVATGAATGITSSGATGHGQVTNAQGESVTEYGVIWNDDGSDPVNKASANHYATGGDGSSNFTAAISGCASGTVYYYRAYATTIAGTSVGNAVQFTTSSVSALTVTTNDASSVAATTAILNGTIIDDGGYSITQHGFVYKIGGDPGEPADPTTAEAYTQEGAGASGVFHSDLSGLTEDATYYVRAYVQTTDDGGHISYGGPIIVRTGHEVTETFYGLVGDGQLSYTAHAASPAQAEAFAEVWTPAGSIDTEATTISLARQLLAGSFYDYVILRACLYFDTSSIPMGSTIVSAAISVYVTSVDGSATEDIQVYDGQPGAPASEGMTPALTVYDYDKDLYAYVGAKTLSVGKSSPNEYREICTFTSVVTPSGLTKLMFQFTDEVIAYTFNSGNAASNLPKLVVAYIAFPAPPTVPKVNIADTWVDPTTALVNINDEWVAPLETKINIGDAWVDPQ